MDALVEMSHLYDPNSCANINDYQTTHLHLELEIDFQKSILTGHAHLTLKKMIDEEKPVELDCSSLNIISITCDHSFLSVRWKFKAT
jgi:aminopeptidase N